MISKELLSLVLDREVIEVVGLDVFDDNMLHFKFNDGYSFLNLDTLTRKMMEFCFNNEVMLRVSTSEATMGIVSIEQSEDEINKVFLESSVFDAVDKATGWVAEEKGLL